MSSGDPTRVQSNYIPVYTTILRQIERCPGEEATVQIHIFLGRAAVSQVRRTVLSARCSVLGSAAVL